jgi:hypothetical protein
MAAMRRTNMEIYYGIVEDRQDPLKVGRVRVRVHGIHTDDKQKIASPDLPWAQVMLPTTSAGLSGFGTQHGLVEGSTVILFFRDGKKCQQPVVIGSTAGIPAGGYKIDALGKKIKRQVEKGFNDPRRLTTHGDKEMTVGGITGIASADTTYDGTPDGAEPDHASKRNFGLTAGVGLLADDTPRPLFTLDIKYTGVGSTITDTEITEDNLPFYPLYTDKSDLAKLAGSDDEVDIAELLKERTIPKDRLLSKKEIKSPAKPVYPYNKVLQSESGHVLEMDDTMGAERLAIAHRSGTFQEIHPDGSQVTRVVNDNYTIICRNEEVFIGGKVEIKVLGDAKIETIGKLELKSLSDGKIDINGNLDIEVGKKLTLSAAEHVKVLAPEFKPNS